MTITDWMRGIGVGLLALGILCFPIGFGASPKRDTSAFSNFADLGVFWKVGVVFIAAGILVLIASSVISSKNKS